MLLQPSMRPNAMFDDAQDFSKTLTFGKNNRKFDCADLTKNVSAMAGYTPEDDRLE